jgi:Tfp pilus assembly protein PilV
MGSRTRISGQAGFSLMELLISMGTMIIVTGAAFALISGSLKFTTTTYHMTDAQQNLRNAHEIITRDLMTAGNGLKGIGTIQVPSTFVSNYLAVSPLISTPGYVNLSIITSDYNVAGTVAIAQSSPSTTVLDKSARLTVLSQDTNWNSGATVSLAAGKITVSGSNTNIAVGTTNVGNFAAGEIYAIVAQNSMAFGLISSINTGTGVLTLTNGDTYGINQTGAGTPINAVSSAGTVATSIMRVNMIHYFVNANKMLVRRVFGVQGAAFIDNAVAEHVANLQFRYITNLPNANGFTSLPTNALTTSQQQVSVRQIETTITTETAKAVNLTTANNGGRQTISSTSSTSVRNMQFRQALSP